MGYMYIPRQLSWLSSNHIHVSKLINRYIQVHVHVNSYLEGMYICTCIIVMTTIGTQCQHCFWSADAYNFAQFSTSGTSYKGPNTQLNKKKKLSTMARLNEVLLYSVYTHMHMYML